MSPSRTVDLAGRDPDESSLRITKFTNCRLVRNGKLVQGDLWINTSTGRIVDAQKTFYADQTLPDRVIDLKGRILAPGFIDVQFNGAFTFDLSRPPADGDMTSFKKGLQAMNRGLIKTGVTSYLATMTSQSSGVYRKILPYLGPLRTSREPFSGAESLGAHCEGPFIASDRKGCHSPEVVSGTDGLCDLNTLTRYYGPSTLGLEPAEDATDGRKQGGAVKMITLAPELSGAMETIQHLSSHGVMVSIGHTRANYEQTVAAVKAGANMITHLFNAMNPLHHRDPGPFGTITLAKDKANFEHLKPSERPCFGIIADGIHLHPASVSLAYSAHPKGLVLVTDAVMFMGCEDGVYEWNNGQMVEKRGSKVTLQGTDTIAGSAVTMLECVNNFINWTGASIAEAIDAVTATPASMLGLADTKGTLNIGADADLVVLLEDRDDNGGTRLLVEEVWKFGTNVWNSPEHSAEVGIVGRRIEYAQP